LVKGPRSHCPIALTLDMLGDRWTLLLLRDLIIRGMTRYQEFLNAGEGISTNILAERLSRLEEHGIIAKSVDPNDKRQFLYSPTQKALDLLPVIFELARWGIKHDSHTDLTIPFVQAMKTDENGLMEGILSRFN
jgi:DNA-binding HxlR family transcriptional regulator